MIKKLTITTLFSLLMAILFSSTTWAAEKPRTLDDVQRITVEELRILQQKEAVVVIDTRAPGQWVRAEDKVPGALRLQSHSDLDRFKQQVPLDHAIVTYCT